MFFLFVKLDKSGRILASKSCQDDERFCFGQTYSCAQSLLLSQSFSFLIPSFIKPISKVPFTNHYAPFFLQEQAFELSQKYKEGKYIIELSHMIKDNGWDWEQTPHCFFSKRCIPST